MDIGYSINPALDRGQVCETDLPHFLFVKVKTAVGICRQNIPSSLFIILFFYPFSQNPSVQASCGTAISYCLKEGRKHRRFRSFWKKHTASAWGV